ncbi:ABC transporter permease [Streptomyces sp. NPDC058451]|uniref:ABC transporter permease n=1 Tax=Streptomyces sp. NPDC058451 TaxID=3346506 RepID=UPI003668CF5F
MRSDQTGQVLLAITLAMVALSTLNTVLLGWSTAVQARRALTIARTLGATPGQVVSELCVAQLLPAVPGVAAGVPAGLGLYWLFGTQVTPPGIVAADHRTRHTARSRGVDRPARVGSHPQPRRARPQRRTRVNGPFTRAADQSSSS